VKRVPGEGVFLRGFRKRDQGPAPSCSQRGTQTITFSRWGRDFHAEKHQTGKRNFNGLQTVPGKSKRSTEPCDLRGRPSKGRGKSKVTARVCFNVSELDRSCWGTPWGRKQIQQTEGFLQNPRRGSAGNRSGGQKRFFPFNSIKPEEESATANQRVKEDRPRKNSPRRKKETRWGGGWVPPNRIRQHPPYGKCQRKTSDWGKGGKTIEKKRRMTNKKREVGCEKGDRAV